MRTAAVGLVCFGLGWSVHRMAFWLHVWRFHSRYHLGKK